MPVHESGVTIAADSGAVSILWELLEQPVNAATTIAIAPTISRCEFPRHGAFRPRASFFAMVGLTPVPKAKSSQGCLRHDSPCRAAEIAAKKPASETLR